MASPTRILLSGDQQSGTDGLLLSGDMQSGTDEEIASNRNVSGVLAAQAAVTDSFIITSDLLLANGDLQAQSAVIDGVGAVFISVNGVLVSAPADVAATVNARISAIGVLEANAAVIAGEIRTESPRRVMSVVLV